MKRRDFALAMAGIPVAGTPVAGSLSKYCTATDDKLVVTELLLHEVKVNARGNWHFVEVKTNKGLSGMGEASHGFALREGPARMHAEIRRIFELVRGESPFNISQFRQRGLQSAAGLGKLSITAFSAIEHALWDLKGKALGVPVYDLLGGKLHNKLKVYANINRATNARDAQGRRLIADFQHNAENALQSGFRAVKLAPFDDMKPLGSSSPEQVGSDIDYAIATVEAVRKTIGNETDLLIDLHSHLNRELAITTARRLEPARLYWYEEAVDPEQYPEDTTAITDAIAQPSAGGEAIFGRKGFDKLIGNRAFDIIMPDVKHCGGIQELHFIAALAESAGNIAIAPHNPSGPVSTAASVQVCAAIPNFSILEYAFGEVPWRAELLSPAEHFDAGYIQVPDAPGLGHALNAAVLKKYSV